MNVYVFENVFVNRAFGCMLVVAETYTEAVQIVVKHYMEYYTTPAYKMSEQVLRNRITCTLIDTKTVGVKYTVK